METSDSECFESADEEVYSENENKKSKNVSGSSAPVKEIPKEIEPLTHFNVIEFKKEPSDSTNKTENDNNLQNKDEESGKCTIVKASDIEVNVNKSDTKTFSSGIMDNKEPDIDTVVQDEKDEVNMWDDDEDWGSDLQVQPERPAKSTIIKHSKTNTNSSIVHNEEHNVDTGIEDEKDELNMWDNDEDWEPIETKPDMPPVTPIKSWGWDLSAMLNAATVGVTTVTSQVSQGLSTVLESGIGAPDPEELARQTIQKAPKNSENVQQTNLFGFGNLVSGVSQITKLVETTGNKVISGGLDTLETIGKKTMQVLQEGDPGLKKKRALLKIEGDKPVLSHILREAKEKAELENKLLEEQHFARKANYESLFDDHQGLVHLEALEMLSKQCSIKLERLLESQSGSELTELQETMNQIVELCELIEDEDELEDISEIKEKLETAVSEMVINISYDKLLTTQTEAEQWLNNLQLQVCSELELHEQAIETLAQLTALAVERYHKIGELLLIKEHRSTADEADSLVQVTTILTTLITNMASKFSNKLSEKLSNTSHQDHLNTLITNVYFESANSTSYLKNAFQLLIPVLQVGAI